MINGGWNRGEEGTLLMMQMGSWKNLTFKSGGGGSEKETKYITHTQVIWNPFPLIIIDSSFTFIYHNRKKSVILNGMNKDETCSWSTWGTKGEVIIYRGGGQNANVGLMQSVD